jgi:hypothetical protein
MGEKCHGGREQGVDFLETQRAQPRMVVRTPALRPAIEPLGFSDAKIVDAGMAMVH